MYCHQLMCLVCATVSAVYLLAVAIAALVHHGVERTPLALHALVALKLHLSLSPLYAVGLVSRYEVREEQRIGALAAIFG